MILTDDQFARKLRKREITPAEGLKMLKNNEVKVYPDPRGGIDYANATWDDIEVVGAGTSAIQHSLFQAGGRDLAEQYSAEIARLRNEGHILEV